VWEITKAKLEWLLKLSGESFVMWKFWKVESVLFKIFEWFCKWQQHILNDFFKNGDWFVIWKIWKVECKILKIFDLVGKGQK
jgi:hypothetical protein